MSKDLLIDHAEYDLNHVVADIEEIRRYNRQRYEFEMLTGILFEDRDRNICVGYLQTTPNDFWVRCHMPEFALMPGVMMCEIAAQLASFFSQKYDLLGAEVVGLGGLEEVRFRGMICPGGLVVVVVQLTKFRRGALIVCRFQLLVDNAIVADGIIKGIPLNYKAPAENLAQTAKAQPQST